MGVKHRIIADLFKRWQTNNCLPTVQFRVRPQRNDLCRNFRVFTLYLNACHSCIASISFRVTHLANIDIGVNNFLDPARPIDAA